MSDTPDPSHRRNCINKVTRREHGFTMISNTVLRDTALSFRARGILAMVLSHSESWLTTHAWIEEQSAKDGREAVRTALHELQRAGHLTEGIQRTHGKIVGFEMHWHEAPLPEGQRQSLPDHRKAASRHPANPGSPDDGNPACGESAPSEYNAEQNTKFLEKQGGGGMPEKIDYPIGCGPAEEVFLDLTVPEEIRRLWNLYHRHRVERHHAKGERKLAWTAIAAKMASESVNRAVLSHGEQMVADRMRTAMEKDWKGLNLDSLGKPYHNETNGNSHQRSGPRKFAALESNGKPGFEVDPLTGEIR